MFKKTIVNRAHNHNEVGSYAKCMDSIDSISSEEDILTGCRVLPSMAEYGRVWPSMAEYGRV